MHILITTDLEGISGVDSVEVRNEESKYYQTAREYLMEDTNAAIAGAFAGGADKVTVIDGHNTGLNFIENKLDKRAIQLPPKSLNTTNVDDYDFDAVFAVGAHAMVGTPHAFLDHTQDSKNWFDYRINGISHGELGQQAACFGMKDIPLVMVSGDRYACDEAERLIPKIITACVKKGEKRFVTQSLPLDQAHKIIFDAAKEAAEKYREIKPYKIKLPATVEVTFVMNDITDTVHDMLPHLERNGRTLSKKIDKVTNYLDLATL